MKSFSSLFLSVILVLSLNACGSEKSSFESACEESGGTLSENQLCICNNIPCAGGSLCNPITKACAATAECDGTWKKCVVLNDGIGYSQECANGILSAQTVCPGNATCADETRCKDLTTFSCSNEGEVICTDGALKTCVNGKYSEKSPCPGNTNGCLSTTECGDCYYRTSTDFEVSCTNNNNGASYKQCTSNYTWSKSDDYNYANCKNDQELGVCKNSYYQLTKGDANRSSIIQSCQNGSWPIETPNNASDWINNKNNDANFRFIMSCNKNSSNADELHLYSNYTKDLYFPQTNTSLNCAELMQKDTYSVTLPKTGALMNDAAGTSYNFIDSLLTALYGSKQYANSTWFINNSIFQWFNCFERNCLSTKFCIDSIVTTDSTINFLSQPYIFTIIDNRYQQSTTPSIILEFEKFDGECNSNRTGIHNTTCDKHTIDMLHRVETVPTDDICSSDPICSKLDLTFDVCHLGSSRSVNCTTRLNDNYECTFNKPNQSSVSDVLCVDFYDKNNNHYAYRFNVDKTELSVVSYKGSITECQADATGKANCPPISKCKSNRCNLNWTGCSDETER